MPPLLPVSTLESSACSTLSRLLAQAFSRLEANDRRTRRQKAGGQEDEKEVREILDCLPTALLESATQKVLDLLTSKLVAQPGCTGGWYASRVRRGVTTTIPGLAAAFRSGNLFAEIFHCSLTGCCRDQSPQALTLEDSSLLLVFPDHSVCFARNHWQQVSITCNIGFLPAAG